MKYTSSPLLMLRQLIILFLAAAVLCVLAIAGLNWLGMESTLAMYGVVALALLACIGQVAMGGRVRVEVTDDEVVVSTPLDGPKRFPRKRYTFSSRVVSHSVNLIPVETERILIAFEGDEAQEIALPNMSKKSFDAIMAALLKDRVLATADAEKEIGEFAEAAFTVPKEEMLRDFRKLIVILAGVGVVLTLGLVGFIGYLLLTKAGPDVPVFPLFAKTIGFSLFVFIGFGIPLLMTYRKRERGIPAAVRIGGDCLEIGDERFLSAEIRRIVATPPEYTAGDFVASRTVTVWTDRGKTAFNFGMRTPGGVWKTVFTEYGEMCVALEKAAVRQGFEFAYDL